MAYKPLLASCHPLLRAKVHICFHSYSLPEGQCVCLRLKEAQNACSKLIFETSFKCWTSVCKPTCVCDCGDRITAWIIRLLWHHTTGWLQWLVTPCKNVDIALYHGSCWHWRVLQVISRLTAVPFTLLHTLQHMTQALVVHFCSVILTMQ
jgi:hypothetical protein